MKNFNNWVFFLKKKNIIPVIPVKKIKVKSQVI